MKTDSGSIRSINNGNVISKPGRMYFTPPGRSSEIIHVKKEKDIDESNTNSFRFERQELNNSEVRIENLEVNELENLNYVPKSENEPKRKRSESVDNSISFKFFIIQDGAQIEVHRLKFDQGLTFDLLREEIIAVSPILEGKSFKFTWKDEEGDDIPIASDKTLSVAIAEQAGVKKININLGDTLQNSSPNVGIVCDGCNVHEFKGLRYQCVICPSFDLCSACESKGVHLQHTMLRYARVINPELSLERMMKLLKEEAQNESASKKKTRGRPRQRQSNVML